MTPPSDSSNFSLYNLPYGIFSTPMHSPRVGMAVGDAILDLYTLAKMGVIDVDPDVMAQPVLNDYIALGKTTTTKVRKTIQNELRNPDTLLYHKKELWVRQQDAKMYLPVRIGDYTDFYSSKEHATNVGCMFRDPKNALLPNWKHLPVGYHGRASSIVPSGTPIVRPQGQQLPPDAAQPIFAPSQKLDFELEMAFVIGDENELGQPIPIDQAEDYIFGLVLFNDWSARDLQKWEYVPLGPFLAKSFASSMAPWIVPLEALEPFRLSGPKQDPEVLPYLQTQGPKNFDITLEVTLTPAEGATTTICQTNYKYLYWSMAQQLTHHSSNGCNLKIGDLMASGTISGPTPEAYGSLLELSWNGTKPLSLKGGATRTFLQDGDTVHIRGFSEKKGMRIGFGTVETQILPSR